MTASPDHPVDTPTTPHDPTGYPTARTPHALSNTPAPGQPETAPPPGQRDAVPPAERDEVPPGEQSAVQPCGRGEVLPPGGVAPPEREPAVLPVGLGTVPSRDAVASGGQGVPVLSGEAGSPIAAELVRRADADRESTREAGAALTAGRRRRVAQCRGDNAEALAAIVRRHGWPTVEAVGGAASTAALMILLHAPDLDFRLRCRDLIAQATADGRCPAVHLAYIADHCAVELGEPQFYGTRINPATLRPYPVRHPQTLDERRRDVGLGPLEEQMRALRAHG